MDDDLNVSGALGSLFELVRDLNKRVDARSLSTADARRAAAAIRDFDRVLAVLDDPQTLPDGAQQLLDERAAARANRDFAASDRLRDELAALGVVVEDTRDGQRWHLGGRADRWLIRDGGGNRDDRSGGDSTDHEAASPTEAASRIAAASHPAAAGPRRRKRSSGGRPSGGAGRPAVEADRPAAAAGRAASSAGAAADRRAAGSTAAADTNAAAARPETVHTRSRTARQVSRLIVRGGMIGRPMTAPRRDDRPGRDARPPGGNRPWEDRPPRRDVPRTDAPSGGRPSGDRPHWRPTERRPSVGGSPSPRLPPAVCGSRRTPAVRRWCRVVDPPYDRSAGPRPDSRGGPRPDSRRDWQPRDNRQGRPYTPPRPAQLDSVDTSTLLGEEEELIAGRRPVEEAFAARREAVRLLVVPERRAALDQLVIHATDAAHSGCRARRRFAHCDCRFRWPPGRRARRQAAAAG